LPTDTNWINWNWDEFPGETSYYFLFLECNLKASLEVKVSEVICWYELFRKLGETVKGNLIFKETHWLNLLIYCTFKKSKMSFIHLNMFSRHLNMSLRHVAWKIAKMSLNHLNIFLDILTWHANILPGKNAKLSLRYFHVSLRHLNIPLRHLAGKKQDASHRF
jgi:hypothetical protein